MLSADLRKALTDAIEAFHAQHAERAAETKAKIQTGSLLFGQVLRRRAPPMRGSNHR